MCGKVVGFGDRVTVEKGFLATEIFQYENREWDQKLIDEHKREEYCGHSYTAEQEFLIDRGILRDNK